MCGGGRDAARHSFGPFHHWDPKCPGPQLTALIRHRVIGNKRSVRGALCGSGPSGGLNSSLPAVPRGLPETDLAPGAISPGWNNLWNLPYIIRHDVFCLNSGGWWRGCSEAECLGGSRPSPPAQTPVEGPAWGKAGIWNPFGKFFWHKPLFPGKTHTRTDYER